MRDADARTAADPVDDLAVHGVDQIARYLTLDYGGYFMCRIATDPDPSDDPYGTSGYTMALSDEPVLDQVIRLQADPHAAPLRENPLPRIQVGVTVTGVSFDGEYDPMRTERLQGAAVELLGSPTFVSTNNTVGSDDTMAFVVEPFRLRITKEPRPEGDGARVVIEAQDDLIPGHPDVKAVDIPDPSIYARRMTTGFSNSSLEAQRSIGVYDNYGYFRDRRRWLQHQIDALEGRIDEPEAAKKMEGYRSRLYQLETWGDRVINKLGFQASWSHRTNGRQEFKVEPTSTADEFLDGHVITNQPWRADYWFGAWDGDLLVGYTKGSLSIPFVPG